MLNNLNESKIQKIMNEVNEGKYDNYKSYEWDTLFLKFQQFYEKQEDETKRLGTLDDETARQRFVDKIFELKSMFKIIILITHLEDVAEQFPNRIMIGWDEKGKSKIY